MSNKYAFEGFKTNSFIKYVFFVLNSSIEVKIDAKSLVRVSVQMDIMILLTTEIKITRKKS